MERDPLTLKGASKVEITGLGQDQRLIFRATDFNVDLFDQYMVYNMLDDHMFWLLVSVPGDDESRWDEADLAAVEYFLKEDFGYDRYDVTCEHVFGENFPRSVPACWNFSVAERPLE